MSHRLAIIFRPRFGLLLVTLIGSLGALTHRRALADESRGDADPLAELSSLGNALADNSAQGGSSIRAKREVDTTVTKRLKDNRNLEAKVDSVQQSKFPGSVLRLKVLQPAKEGAGKDVARNDMLVVFPHFKIEKGQVLLTDADTVINAGSFYLQAGDRVAVRLGAKRDKVWEAEYVERM